MLKHTITTEEVMIVSKDCEKLGEAIRYDLTVWDKAGKKTEVVVATIRKHGKEWVAEPYLYPGVSEFKHQNKSAVDAEVRNWCQEMVRNGSYLG